MIIESKIKPFPSNRQGSGAFSGKSQDKDHEDDGYRLRSARRKAIEICAAQVANGNGNGRQKARRKSTGGETDLRYCKRRSHGNKTEKVHRRIKSNNNRTQLQRTADNKMEARYSMTHSNSNKKGLQHAWQTANRHKPEPPKRVMSSGNKTEKVQMIKTGNTSNQSKKTSSFNKQQQNRVKKVIREPDYNRHNVCKPNKETGQHFQGTFSCNFLLLFVFLDLKSYYWFA